MRRWRNRDNAKGKRQQVAGQFDCNSLRVGFGSARPMPYSHHGDHSVAIHFMHYNFVRIHQSLRLTPAMAAGVTTNLWSLSNMARALEDWEARRHGTLLIG